MAYLKAVVISDNHGTCDKLLNNFKIIFTIIKLPVLKTIKKEAHLGYPQAP